MKRKAKEKRIKVVYKYAEGVSEEESRRRLDTAFGILFDVVLTKQKK